MGKSKVIEYTLLTMLLVVALAASIINYWLFWPILILGCLIHAFCMIDKKDVLRVDLIIIAALVLLNNFYLYK
ncbi:hypothetical protein [Listeria monocytogenes]|uniref:Uncharacterized protein n=3 Tax=Listeria monocytogenes TaxID=1639 RepID=A0A6X4QN79_LISMN|nr:hypothetical protein [Listeria monocytogenes]ACK38495.1 hypothetical protein LMHCC_0133 [Listeria monocytogenes HCC23]AEH93514.1 hypothetical protein LMM7_2509 [Listeria monocytogenes M7]AKS55022.1 hypothetical protein LM850658_12500 [Listeria monocytogenes]AYY71211.1 hypothetical protein EGX77_08530 [Listeria monocytogenes]EAC3110368.1 hypothetical protein [Listeria monocytogenes]